MHKLTCSAEGYNSLLFKQRIISYKTLLDVNVLIVTSHSAHRVLAQGEDSQLISRSCMHALLSYRHGCLVTGQISPFVSTITNSNHAAAYLRKWRIAIRRFNYRKFMHSELCVRHQSGSWQCSSRVGKSSLHSQASYLGL